LSKIPSATGCRPRKKLYPAYTHELKRERPDQPELSWKRNTHMVKTMFLLKWYRMVFDRRR